MKKIIEKIIEKYNLKCSVNDFVNNKNNIQDKVDWRYISQCQKLTESFIEKYQNKVDWNWISECQNLTESFIKKYRDKIDISLYRKTHKNKTYKQKYKEACKYAEKHNLKVNKKYLYAFRNHDFNGCGFFNKTISYKKGIYYRDWHCNTDESNSISFGIGIWPKGNTKVRVKIIDWGCEVKENTGKARVWGFTII